MRVLVIRLGAFGDFVQSFGPFAAIRARQGLRFSTSKVTFWKRLRL